MMSQNVQVYPFRRHKPEEKQALSLTGSLPLISWQTLFLAVAAFVLARANFLGGLYPFAPAFVAAAVVAMFYRRWGWIYMLMAALVGYSRMYTGVHWPSDVAFSVILGTAFGIFGTLGIERLWRRWGGRVFPKWRERHPSLLGGHDE